MLEKIIYNERRPPFFLEKVGTADLAEVARAEWSERIRR
jgi:hypothetical protein